MSLTLTPIQNPLLRHQPPIQLHATLHALDPIDRETVLDKILSSFLPDLASHVDLYEEHHYDTGATYYKATLSVVPLDTRQCILNDQYTYNSQHFTRAEIDAAIQHTYPERFI